MKFCTRHDSNTVMNCAKLWSVEHIFNQTTQNVDWISNLIDIPLMRWAPGMSVSESTVTHCHIRRSVKTNTKVFVNKKKNKFKCGLYHIDRSGIAIIYCPAMYL